MTFKIPHTSIQISGVAKTLGSLPLFSDVNFQVQSGEALVLRGENGSGKTTLLRILAGLLTSDEGDVAINFVEEKFLGAELAVCCHYLGHQNGLKAAETVRQNLDFWGAFGSDSIARSGAEISPTLAAASRLNIERLLDLPTQVLSAGQKRRAAFARLLVSARPIWLLDEPTAALDTTSSELVEVLVQEHLDNGGLCIAATHLPFLQNSADILDMATLKPAIASQPLETDGWN